MKRSIVGIDVLRAIAGRGNRIFTIDDVREEAIKLGIAETYASEMMSRLYKLQWVERIKPGVFAFKSASGLLRSPHEFEIAQALAPTSAVSHWTAMHYHHLTQQTPNITYSITPNRVVTPHYLKARFYFHHVKPTHFFGYKKCWIDHETQVNITDIEKTLIDGLAHPGLCGDFHEVYNAFKLGLDNKLKIPKLIDYALQHDTAIIKRLGWMLEHFQTPMIKLRKLLNHPIKGYRKLSAHGSIQGHHDSKWMIIVNI